MCIDVDMAVVNWVFVFALTAVVPAVMLAANEDEAFKMLVLVVLILLLAVARVVPRLDDAFRTLVFVVASLVPSAASVVPSELDALVTSDCTARLPELSPAPVS